MWRSIENETPGVLDYVLIHDGEYGYDVARFISRGTDGRTLWRSCVTGSIMNSERYRYWMPIPIFVPHNVVRKVV